MNHTPLA